MTNPAHTEPVVLAAAVAILLNAFVLIIGKRVGLGDGEVVAIQSGVTAIAGAVSRWRVTPTHAVNIMLDEATKPPAKKQ